MSYNREWDRGKEWNDYDNGYGHSRGRAEEDEQYHNGGKRRKYNSGAYDETHYTSYEGGNVGASASAQQEYQHDHSYDDRQQRAQQPRKRHVASEPSPHVIFLGLDTDYTESDLFDFLKQQGSTLEAVTIIRDRSTGQSKGFGFAQFKSIEHARAFVDPHFPFISLPPPASHGASAAAAFKKAIATGGQHNGRRVKIDYSQSANPSERGRRGPQFSNDGTRDIGNSQAPVLLFRTLDALSGPGAIAQAMQASSGHGQEGAKGMKRILVIKDKVTMASWCFAFVEFIDVQSASATLAATMSPQLHPNGFRISDRPVAASFAHPYSFQPVPDNVIRDETCVPSSSALGGLEGAFVKYWDEGATISVMEFQVQEPVLPVAETVEKRKDKKKTKVVVAEPTAMRTEPSALPASTKPVALSFNKSVISGSKSTTGPTAASTVKAVLGFATIEDPNAPNNEDESGNQIISVEESKAKAAQKVPPLIASKKVVNNISKWNQVQEVLHHDEPSRADTVSVPTPSLKASVTPPPVAAAAQISEFEYSDTKAMTCLLCSRQFKTLEVLKRHNLESELHKKNLKDSRLRDLAREKAEAARSKSQNEEPAMKYRDRASERRSLHNQPEAPVLDVKPAPKRHAEGPRPLTPPPPPPVAPGKDQNNVGNKLLKLMGWTEGSGLGTEGEGRVDPIQTAIYASGAGLGASKGKGIGLYTEGSGSYADLAKHAARERYGDSQATSTRP